MQDKEVVYEDANDAPTTTDKKSDSLRKDKKDSGEDHHHSKKHQHAKDKDGKFQFRRMKQPKKEKDDKKSASRFKGEGVTFKAKLIGVENVPEPRGDKMCQDAMQLLKLNVKNLGPHKRKILVCVSLQGIKIKDEKNLEVLYHHPVALISFISQDITDARAFGYVAGSSAGHHQFIAIKTEKPAFHVVVALRDLFQTVLDWKQEKMVQAKMLDNQDAASSVGSDCSHEKSSVNENVTDSVSEEEKSIKEENIYFDVILAEPFTMREEEPAPVQTVDDLLGLQDELNKLQQGIAQMDTSIAAATYTIDTNPVEKDPFDTSFVTPSGPKIDAFPQPMPAPVPVSVAVPQYPTPSEQYQDKYAVFNALTSEPSIFENAASKDVFAEHGHDDLVPDLNELEEEIRKKTVAPAKPPRNAKTAATPAVDLSLFADLDPLGKDRPYKDKTEFFQDVKNPPKKVLNDLVNSNNNGYEDFANLQNVVGSPPLPASSPACNIPSQNSFGVASSSLPNSSFNGNLKFSMGFAMNGNNSPFNPFDNESQVTNGSIPNGIHQQNGSSAPIPIPNRNHVMETKERSVSSSSSDSTLSRSPCVNQNGSSPTQNGLSSSPNGEVKSRSNSQNGVSRPRPRPSANKGPKSGSLTIGSHLLSPSDNDSSVRRESMQSVTKVIRMNGNIRTRADSLPVMDNHRNFRIPMSTDANIFSKKADPFGDDFFCSLPKRVPNHLTQTEIRDYV